MSRIIDFVGPIFLPIAFIFGAFAVMAIVVEAIERAGRRTKGGK